MASQGPLSPAAAANDNDFAGAAGDWTNPTNVFLSNDTRATSICDGTGDVSEGLLVTEFAFSVSGLINGIVVEFERSESNADDNIADETVRLTKNGTSAVGDNKAVAGEWPTTDGYASYGSSTDLWGLTWTAAEINATTFGVKIAAVSTGTTPSARIDHVRLTVHYTPIRSPGGPLKPLGNAVHQASSY